MRYAEDTTTDTSTQGTTRLSAFGIDELLRWLPRRVAT